MSQWGIQKFNLRVNFFFGARICLFVKGLLVFFSGIERIEKKYLDFVVQWEVRKYFSSYGISIQIKIKCTNKYKFNKKITKIRLLINIIIFNSVLKY